MSYKKPKCDCGEELIFWSQPVYTVVHFINTNGKKSKRTLMDYAGEGIYERLKCEECDKEYDFEFDEKDRVIRGEDFTNYC
jgi:hypothetical protein